MSFVISLDSSLIIAALFDREVNCRRAASVSTTFLSIYTKNRYNLLSIERDSEVRDFVSKSVVRKNDEQLMSRRFFFFFFKFVGTLLLIAMCSAKL